MPRLILLNGPPGSGKSTLARRYADEHPPTADLDVDVIRSLIGSWRSRLTEAGLLARAMTVAMARTHLEAAHDVIVPQYLGRVDFVVQLDELAAATGADFVELALLDDAEASYRRFQARSASGVADVEAAVSGLADYRLMYSQLQGVLAARPATRKVTTTDGEIGAAYAAVLAAVLG